MQGPTLFVSDLRPVSSRPMGSAFNIRSAPGKNSLQIAFLVADISTHAHPVSADQGRQCSFHARTMLSVVFFEGFCFLTHSGRFCQVIVGTDANRASAFAGAAARAQFSSRTSFRRESKTQAVIHRDRICGHLAFGTNDDIIFCIDLKLRLSDPIR